MSRNNIQSAALDALENCDRCGIAVSMGVGKTLIGLQHMARNYTDTFKVLIVAPKKSIFKSWKDEAEKFNMGYLLDHVKFTTYLSLNKQDLDYDGIYLDECHSLLYTHESWLSNFKGYIVGMTGTPPRFAMSEKGVMVNKYCPIKYKYITDDAVSDGILNDYRIMVHVLSLDTKKNYANKTKKGGVFYTSELANYNYWTHRLMTEDSPKSQQILRVLRMKALMGYKSKETYAKALFDNIPDKCILFANTQEQADKLCEFSYHSTNKLSEVNLDKFKSGEINKLSCVLQLNEGVNIPDLKQGIIMHAYGNERKSAQRLGRLLRLNPDQTAIIHILCYDNTVDLTWVKKALEQYDETKINWIKNGIQESHNN
jgi:superfamily II DNA or RNA helicase